MPDGKVFTPESKLGLFSGKLTSSISRKWMHNAIAWLNSEAFFLSRIGNSVKSL